MDRSRSFSPWMGILGLFVLFFLFTKGMWLLPMILLFGWFMWSKGGSHRQWSWHCDSDEFEKRKNDAYDKRKNDGRFDEFKRKNDEDVYYV